MMNGKFYLWLHVVLGCFAVAFQSSVSEKKLEMVHLLYRHGARSPVHFYPKDPNPPSVWVDGPGRLTQIGMHMEYELGKFLKERYMNNSFLDNEYVWKQVYVRSSDSERCLQSAESQLAGLFPPSGRQIWNPDIKWQPVPVHTVPPDQDPLLRPDDTVCPRLYELFEEVYERASWKEKERQSKELIKLVARGTGLEDLDLKTFSHPVDTLHCEMVGKLDVPDWAIENWKSIKQLEDWWFSERFSGSDEFGRLSGGALLGKINANMRSWIGGLKNDLYKMNIFSGHDTSILSLSAALNINLHQVPPFSTCIMIELYSVTNGSYFVEINYRNDTSGVIYQLRLPNCTMSCPLDKFLAETKSRVPVDREKECNVHTKDINSNNMLIALCMLAGVIAMSFFFLLARNLHSRLKKQKNFSFNKMEQEEALMSSVAS